MIITLRLICESLSRIAVKIRFLWFHKLCVYAAASFAATHTSWYLGNDMQKCASVICIWISNVSLSAYKIVILKSYTVPVRLHEVTNFLNQKAFSSKHVSIFLPRKYDVISQLRHSYVKDPLCVTRLMYNFK